MSLSIGWMSDAHLSKTQYGMPKRRLDMLYAFKQTLVAMNDAGVDIVIHTGDLFDNTRPSSETMIFLREVHDWLGEKNLLCYCLTGNHEYTAEGKQWVETLKPHRTGGGFRLLDNQTLELGGVKVHGLPSMNNKALIQSMNSPELDGVDVLCLHVLCREFLGFQSQSALSMEDIPDKFQAVLMGDIHVTDIRQRPSGGIIGYPGSLELTRDSESIEKFWIKLQFSEGRLVKYDKMPGFSRPVLQWVVDKSEDVDRLLKEFPDVEECLKQRDERTPMIFVKYMTDVPDVMSRIRQQLPAEDYIIIPQPQMPISIDAPDAPNGSPVADIGILDLLQSQVPQSDSLFIVASQLLTPDADAKSAIATFVEERLRLSEQEEECVESA